MKHAVAIYLRLISVQIRSRLQYRTSFILGLLSTGFITLLEFSSIALVITRLDGIQGWALGEVAFLYGLVEFAFGLMDMILTGFDPPRFGRLVRLGLFDQLLLRPVHITAQVLGSDFELRRLGKSVLGLVIFLYAITHIPIEWTVWKLLYLPIVAGSIFLFFGGLFIIGATITFWTVDSIEVMNILTYGGSFVISYPMHIYQSWLRRFFTYVLPAIFLNYYPALYFLDKTDPLQSAPFLSFLAPLAGVMVMAVGLAFWRYGIGQYQSTGS